MSPVTETVLFVFGLVALGYCAGWSGYLKTQTGDGLAEFAVGVAMPLLLFRTMISADFHGAARGDAGLFGGGHRLGGGKLRYAQLFGRDSAAGVVGGVATAFSNLVLLGIPFTLGVFGQEGVDVLSLLISVHLPTMMMASIIMFELFGRSDREPRPVLTLAADFARKIAVNPLIAGILAGLAWRVTGLPLPSLALRFVDAWPAFRASGCLPWGWVSDGSAFRKHPAGLCCRC